MGTLRNIDTDLWYQDWFEPLPAHAKLVYVYAFSNRHGNAAGLYRITIQRIGQETGLRVVRAQDAIDRLKGHLTYFPSQGLLWVRGFLEHQINSPVFLKGVLRMLREIEDPSIVQEFLGYNSNPARPSSVASRFPNDWATLRQSLADHSRMILKARARAVREGEREREGARYESPEETRRKIDQMTRDRG